MTIGDRILKFYSELPKLNGLPQGVEALYPFKNPETWRLVTKFFQKYYNDTNPRILLMGINPGRFGAGKTGVGFTDPIRLKEVCGIENDFDKKPELSSKFIYDVIEAYGGPGKFYKRFLISSVCPIGFIRDGKNYNYYDDPALEKQVEPFVIDCFKKKLELGCESRIAFSVGQGKNVKFLNRLNDQHKIFGEIGVLPHPRWVMQYRLKRKDEFVELYLKELDKVT